MIWDDHRFYFLNTSPLFYSPWLRPQFKAPLTDAFLDVHVPSILVVVGLVPAEEPLGGHALPDAQAGLAGDLQVEVPAEEVLVGVLEVGDIPGATESRGFPAR